MNKGETKNLREHALAPTSIRPEAEILNLLKKVFLPKKHMVIQRQKLTEGIGEDCRGEPSGDREIHKRVRAGQSWL